MQLKIYNDLSMEKEAVSYQMSNLTYSTVLSTFFDYRLYLESEHNYVLGISFFRDEYSTERLQSLINSKSTPILLKESARWLLNQMPDCNE